MIYKFFIVCMDYLRHLYGYKVAIEIKNLGDAAIVFVIGGYVMSLLWAKFWTEVELDPKFDPEMIIVEMESSPRRYVIKSKNVFATIVGFVSWCIVRVSHRDSYKVTSIKRVITVLIIFSIILLAFGLLFTIWPYVPDNVK
ncbi:MAG: hypothetical protein P4L59_16465 [Desulfosporosinus sp.]|nr:hypothetical protein [Desulfosporosinus sp.]